MKNPLRKRYLRELKRDIGKYMVIFLFMSLTIGFISGFLVADDSMKTAYDNSFEKYNIEDGNFELMYEKTDGMFDEIEDKYADIYENFNKEFQAINSKTKIRVFAERKEINKVSLMSGKMPKNDGEIAIDRMFADNNSIKVGDTFKMDESEYKVTGLVALSDYSALFEDNSDMMFDSINFGVGIVTQEQFDKMSDAKLHYVYSWKNHKKNLSDKAKKTMGDDICKVLVENGAAIKSITPVTQNQAIQFTGDDMGGDKSMMMALLYIIIVIMAFIFGVTVMNTIDNEASEIGTLRAMGYTRGEMVRHYMMLPVIVTLVAGIIGNILGYSMFKGVVVDMYYGSYSLPTYKTIWNADAFILTTVVPCVLMFVINLIILNGKLKLSPLKFLRHDLKARKSKRAVKLPDFKFKTRFRLRILLQNKANYIIMFIAVIFANLLLVFGFVMTPILDNYGDIVKEQMFCKYQYVLKQPVETENESAEKYCAGSLKLKGKDDEINIYGVDKDSKYVKDMKLDTSGNEVYVSHGIMEKYGYEPGDKIVLKDKYSGDEYTMTIKGKYTYSASMAVFMSCEQYNKIFDKDSDYFNGYFSDEKLEDIDENNVATTITLQDMTKVVRQLKKSMGSMMPLFSAFAMIMAALMFYLLSKIVIEKNASSISMVKILGYNSKEIGSFYVASTTIAALVFIIISIPACELFMRGIYLYIMNEMSGWIDYYVAPSVYAKTIVMSVTAYILSAVLQYRKIGKVNLERALKDME